VVATLGVMVDIAHLAPAAIDDVLIPRLLAVRAYLLQDAPNAAEVV